MARFAYRQGRSVRNIPPQTVGDELERIRSTHGRLTPELVVQEATDEDNVLHSAFEWQDEFAAHQFRISQARSLIISVRILDDPCVRNPIVPAYVSVRVAETGRQYLPVRQALTAEELRHRVLDETRTFFEALRRRYQGFAEVVDLIDQLEQEAG